MIFKLRYGPIKAIKPQLKLFVLGFFVIIGLVAANLVLADILFETSFEPPYNIGDLVGQQGWTGSAAKTYVQNSVVKDGVQAIALYHHAQGYYAQKNGASTCAGIVSFWFQVRESAAAGNTIYFEVRSVINGIIGYVGIRAGVYNKEVYLYHNTGTILLGSYPEFNAWYPMEIQWDCATKQIRAKLNYGEWSNWYVNKDNTGENAGSIYLQHNQVSPQYADYYIDLIGGAFCSPDNCQACQTWNTCVAWEECFWDFDYSYCLPHEFCCGCGFEYEKCMFCDTQEECEEIEDCYWTEELGFGFCWYGGEQCGPGLNCQFCLDEATCEAEDCYWYGDFCWQESPPAVSSWATWYDNYGDYENPAPLVNTLATGSQSFFEAVGGFLTTFQKTFDLQAAFQNGKNLGQVLPKARGYLAILDGFAGKLPFGTIFMFLIMFMLAIGTFRITRALIQLVKFW